MILCIPPVAAVDCRRMGQLNLILIRHGESSANVQRETAVADGLEVIAVDCRDADVPLSDLGTAQATAAGHGLINILDGAPVQAWASPYVRACRTGELAQQAAGFASTLRLDERLRDRELGILDRLTSLGIQNRYPQEAERRRWQGKFYYRPPGGESWADLALRVRAFLADLDRTDVVGDVCVFTHDAVISVFRYACLGLTETEVLQQSTDDPVGNASITVLSQDGTDAPWTQVEYNNEQHLIGEAGRDLRSQHPGDPDVHPH